MKPAATFKDQLVGVSSKGTLFTIEADSDLTDGWMAGDDHLDDYIRTNDIPGEQGLYKMDIEVWVYGGTWEYEADIDVEFEIENVRKLDIELPESLYAYYSEEHRLDSPEFVELDSDENYVTDKNTPPFRDVRLRNRRKSSAIRNSKRRKHIGKIK